MTNLNDFNITSRWPAKDPSVVQLYSFPTPNGVKVSIALEEMGIAYEPHLVTLSDVDVKSAEFLSLNPNNKIPAIIDPNGPDGAPIGLFESGAILLYLAEKSGKLAGTTAAEKAHITQWLMFQMGGLGPTTRRSRLDRRRLFHRRHRDRPVAARTRILRHARPCGLVRSQKCSRLP